MWYFYHGFDIHSKRRSKVDPKATSEIEEQDEAIDIAADSHLEKSHATAFGFGQKIPNRNYFRTFLQCWKGVYVKIKDKCKKITRYRR